MNKTLQKLKEDSEKRLDAQYEQLKRYKEAQAAIEVPPLSFVGKLMGHFLMQSLLYVLVLIMVMGFIFNLIPDLGIRFFVAIGIPPDAGMIGIHILSGGGLLLCALLILVLITARGKVADHVLVVDELSELLKEVIVHEELRVEEEKKSYLRLLEAIDADKNRPEGH